MFSILYESMVTDKDIQFNIKLNQEFFRNRSRTFNKALMLIPDFEHVTNGGPNTLFRFAYYLAGQGIKITLALVDASIHKEINSLVKDIQGEFGVNPNVEFMIVNSDGERFNQQLLPDSDICIATLWTTAYYLLGYTRTKGKFYFIQDYESLFYPAGSESALADLTYKFGYVGIFNTPGLMRAVQSHHSIQGMSFIPGVDRTVFYPSSLNTVQQRDEVIRIIFYGRPPIARNMYDLGKSALKFVKAKYGKRVEILFIGWDDQATEYTPFNFKREWLGYIPYNETGNVYRSCHIGLALMATPHSSYLPIQFMSCGVVPVVTKSPYTEWLFTHEENCISCYPTAHNFAEGISRLIEDPGLRTRLHHNATLTTRDLDWEKPLHRIYEFLVSGSI